MNSHIARQPIFDKNLNLYGYELLFRDRTLNFAVGADGDAATSELLSSTFLTSDIGTYTGGKKAFINFTQKHLLSGVALLFPKKLTVVEILENVDPNPQIVVACQELARNGFTIALDDFIYRAEIKALISLANIIKIDFRNTSPERISAYFSLLTREKKQMLAEKVETYEEFNNSRKLGFDYFQGYFFAKPEVMRSRHLTTPRLHLLKLMAEVNRGDLDFDQIENHIKRDVTLSYKLLRYINSAYFRRVQEINSIRQAIVLLGAAGVRSFVSLMAMAKLAKGKPPELVALSAMRARFCERLASHMGLADSTGELFTVGLFSLIDAILDDSMEAILKELPFSGKINEALMHHSGLWGDFLNLVVAYERGGWDRLPALCSRLGLDENDLPPICLESLEWGQAVTAL